MTHIDFLRRTYILARLSGATVRTNPNVGAVLVHNGKIIGEGWHKAYGEPHAEVNAIANVPAESRHLIPEATFYVSLEPCCHYGKTPPCTELIVRSKIKNVHIGCLDPSDKVAGKGVQFLKEHGVKVTVHHDGQAKYLLRPFVCNSIMKRPFITLKYAQSRDYYMGRKDHQVWLSNTYTGVLTHKLRAENHAIIVGTQTIRTDNPRLNVRHTSGTNPKRLIIDNNLTLSEDLHVFADDNYMIFTRKKTDRKDAIVLSEDDDYLSRILEYCIQHNLGRLMVEGGKRLIESFIQKGLWDIAYVYDTDVHLENGIKSPSIPGELREKYTMDNNEVLEIVNPSR